MTRMSDIPKINAELAAVFEEVGNVLQYQGEAWFKVRSYLEFAQSLRAMDAPIDSLSPAALDALPGVGAAISSKVRDYLSKGTFNLLDRVRMVDGGVRELLAAGLAPAAVRELEQKLSLRGVAAVRAAHKAGSLDLAALPTRQRNQVKQWLEQGG